MKALRFVRLSLLMGIAFVCLASSRTAHATSGADFEAGNIIDDSVFVDTGTMSAVDIQNFLNAKLPTCDTWGAQQSEYGGGTRAQYGAAHNNPAPFTCLKDYWQNPSTGADNYGGKPIPSGAKSAAQIIYDYSLQFGINPQVILVTLQKENNMVFDDWPFAKQYREAMGFGCPDNVAPGAPACDPNYGSFSAQVYEAARHFRNFYDLNPNWTIPYRPGWNSILWNPNTACGRSDVNILNRATAALYDYTPYRPNQAALNNLYGLGDDCSSYGNRNFWRYFTDWFGSTKAQVAVTSGLQVSQDELGSTYTKEVVTVQFYVTNRRSYPVDIGELGVAAYDSAGNNVGFPMLRAVIPAFGTILYSGTQVFDKEDTYQFWILSHTNGVWRDDYPVSANPQIVRKVTPFIQAAPVLTQSLSYGTSIRQNATTNATFTINNPSARTLNLGQVGVAAYDSRGKNVGLPLDTVSIPAGGNYTYTKPAYFTDTGTVSAFITSTKNNGVSWNNLANLQATPPISKSVSFAVKPSPAVTVAPALSVASPRVGRLVTGSFKVSNFSDAALDNGKVGMAIYGPNGQNAGLPLTDLKINAKGELAYSYVTSFSAPGRYTAWIAYTKNGMWDDYNYPVMDEGLSRRFTFDVLPSPTIIESPSVSISSPRVGQNTNVTFKVKNYGDSAVDNGVIGLAIYGPNGENVGLPMVPLRIDPQATLNYSFPSTFTKEGTYTAWITYMKNGNWDNTAYPQVDSDLVKRRITFTVLPSPTITQQPTLGTSAVKVNQSTTISFIAKNYGDSAVDNGVIGLAIYGPNGENLGLPMVSFKIDAGSQLVYQYPVSFSKAGTYTAWITHMKNGVWNDTTYPPMESSSLQRKVQFTVSP